MDTLARDYQRFVRAGRQSGVVFPRWSFELVSIKHLVISICQAGGPCPDKKSPWIRLGLYKIGRKSLAFQLIQKWFAGSLGFVLALFALTTLEIRQTTAGEIQVAVASNYTNAARAIASRFEAGTGHKVTLVFGSTGKHYAQIRNGAPFDLFFAADVQRPELLEKEGIGIAGTRFTYAVGKLVLWSPEPGYVDSLGRVLQQADFRHLAIANPRLAPYGKAAQEVLQALGLWDYLKTRIVRGENVGQTFQFVKSGNARLGFVAFSQLSGPGQTIQGSFWKVPQTLYAPVEQQAIQLKTGDVANVFLTFVRTEEVLNINRSYGYETP
jgi:molybdate transport system substrate-binding protein